MKVSEDQLCAEVVAFDGKKVSHALGFALAHILLDERVDAPLPHAGVDEFEFMGLANRRVVASLTRPDVQAAARAGNCRELLEAIARESLEAVAAEMDRDHLDEDSVVDFDAFHRDAIDIASVPGMVDRLFAGMPTCALSADGRAAARKYLTMLSDNVRAEFSATQEDGCQPERVALSVMAAVIRNVRAMTPVPMRQRHRKPCKGKGPAGDEDQRQYGAEIPSSQCRR